LPYSKHFHLLASPFGVFFTDLEPRGRMRGEPEEESETAPFDARRFTWRELLTPLACAECGRCDRACPAFNSGEPLSPQDLIHGVKEHVLEIGAMLGKKNGAAPARPLFEGIITPAEIWACTTCYSCMEHCPVRNEHLPLIFRMRRYAVSEGKMDARLQETLTAFMRYGNSYGQSERDRAKWTKSLPFKIPDARKQPVKYLWFVGDTASYDARLGDAVRATATLFQAAGLDFGILYEAERNAGNDVRRTGEEGLFELLAQKNIAALKKCTFEEIITTDPHTYNTLKNEYPALGAAWPVRHYTEILLDLILSGALPIEPLEGKKVTYHDPCYLGRYNGIYQAPRRILRSIGARLVEMPRHGRDGYCCGAGGGRIWMEDSPSVKERPSESRVREAAALRGVDTVVTACPKDIVMFLDAVKTTGLEGTLFIRDIAELVLQAATIPAHTAQET
ncbi:MAG: (Fe-S)-binding protein, partial [Bacteroidota bacterium]|nr:(Fe-S)-binding protein [Bacteroidota bacterium]